MKADLPTLSVVVPTFQAAHILKRCLKAVRAQTYPQDKIEIIVVDGGSTDETLAIAERYGSRIIRSRQRDQEHNRMLGVFEARHEILVFLDADNILTRENWLADLTQPFLEDAAIVATQPWRYAYEPSLDTLNRYFALIGANDPVAGYYLDKRDRLNYIEDGWQLAGEATDCGPYLRIEFQADRVPPLGANGYLVRREILVDHADCTPETAHHIDLNYDLIKKGYNTYGIVKTDILHLSNPSIRQFFIKKIQFAQRHHLHRQTPRRCPVYDQQKDKLKILRFIAETVTFVFPVVFSMRGYMKLRDMAWFFHPVACWLFMIAYIIAVLRKR